MRGLRFFARAAASLRRALWPIVRMPLPTIIIAALLAVAPPAVRTDPIMRRPDAPMRLPAVARAHTAVISVDRARIERFAREGGGLLAMPLANTRVAMLKLHPSDSFTADARIEVVRAQADGTLKTSPVELRGAFLAGSIVDEPGTHAFLAVSDAGTFGYVETATNTYTASWWR